MKWTLLLLCLCLADKASAHETPLWEQFPPDEDEDIDLISRLPADFESTLAFPLEAVAATVLDLNWRQGPCGRWCTTDRAEWVDEARESYVISYEEALELAGALSFWSQVFPEIPIESAMAVAWHETKFHRYARGRSGEAGIFQQHLVYLHPESARDTLGLADRVLWLYDLEFSVYVFYLNAYGDLQEARSNRRGDDYWSCFYHEGETCSSNGMNYRADHLEEARRMRLLLEHYREMHEGGTLEAFLSELSPRGT